MQTIDGEGISPEKLARVKAMRAAQPGLSHLDALKIIRDQEAAEKEAGRSEKGKKIQTAQKLRKQQFDAFVAEYMDEVPGLSKKDAEKIIRDNKWFKYKKPETRLRVHGETKRKRMSQKQKDREAAKAELDISHFEEPTHEEIKKRYKKMALKWHPDKWRPSSPHTQAEHAEKFRRINAAYETLTGEGFESVLNEMNFQNHIIPFVLSGAAH